MGFSAPGGETPGALPYAVTIVVRLSDAIVDEIDDAPTEAYFHHYRTVNAQIDRLCLLAGQALESQGYTWYPVAASQSMNRNGWQYKGLYSHKRAACGAGLGRIGKNALFLHRQFGPRVRLGTVFTNAPLPVSAVPPALPDICAHCGICVRACPAHALTGTAFSPALDRSAFVDAAACSTYMKAHFESIGRGAVCGICMRVCPAGRRAAI